MLTRRAWSATVFRGVHGRLLGFHFGFMRAHDLGQVLAVLKLFFGIVGWITTGVLFQDTIRLGRGGCRLHMGDREAAAAALAFRELAVGFLKKAVANGILVNLVQCGARNGLAAKLFVLSPGTVAGRAIFGFAHLIFVGFDVAHRAHGVTDFGEQRLFLFRFKLFGFSFIVEVIIFVVIEIVIGLVFHGEWIFVVEIGIAVIVQFGGDHAVLLVFFDRFLKLVFEVVIVKVVFVVEGFGRFSVKIRLQSGA